MMPRACGHNQRGFAALPVACLPYLTLLRQKEKHRQLSTRVCLNRCPPRCLSQRAEAGAWAVPGAALRWHRAVGTGDQRLFLAELSPYATRMEPQLIYAGL